MSTGPLRIANASGFYGDRFDAVREMVTGGHIDVLTGDYLAELTMLILAMGRLKDPSRGYAGTFVRQMEDCLGLAMDAGVKIVVNAGGLNPAGLADRLRELSGIIGVSAHIAHVEGDDLLPRADELGYGSPLAANAYLGAFGIAAALNHGADVVVTGRVTDASLVVGPAVAHFGWSIDDLDPLAGAVAAGHVIECGTQATGGNFARFTEIADLLHPGFPIAEVFEDGSSVITKHDGTGGAVTRDTVTAQLLYEIGGARYAGPDVTTRFDTIQLGDDGPDRVRLSGAVGEPPPSTLKVGLNTLGGHRNEVVFVLTGLDIEAKAALVKAQMADAVDADMKWTLARTDHPNAATEQEASALLQCVVRSDDPDVVGRAFSGAAIELALASYPGFNVTAPPSNGSPYGVFTAAYLDANDVDHVAVTADGIRHAVAAPTTVADLQPVEHTFVAPKLDEALQPDAPSRELPLGTIALARSGDKGGSANIGVWVRTDTEWAWLVTTLTVDRLKELLPETAGLNVTRHVFANLRAVNFWSTTSSARASPRTQGSTPRPKP
jgi:hypothetical protein